MASTQNAPSWRSNLDLVWECHEESLVFYINMTWIVQIGVREESVNLLSRTSIHKKAAFWSDSHFRKCFIQNFIFLFFYFWRKQVKKRLYAKIKVFQDNLETAWGPQVEMLKMAEFKSLKAIFKFWATVTDENALDFVASAVKNLHLLYNLT